MALSSFLCLYITPVQLILCNPPENLISLNPDAIVYVTSKRFEATDADAIDRLLNEPTIQNVPAIANKKILKIGYDDIMDYGARDISTVGVLANFLYSE